MLFFIPVEIILGLPAVLHRFNNKNGALRLYGEPENYFKNPPPQKDWLISSSGHYCPIIIIYFLRKLKMVELLSLQKE